MKIHFVGIGGAGTEPALLADAVMKIVRSMADRQTVIITIGSGEPKSILTELIRIRSQC